MSHQLPLSFVHSLYEELDAERFQDHFLRALMQIQDVQRGSIWIYKGEDYVCSEAAGPEAEKVKGLAISANRPSIVGSVIKTGKMTVAEAGKDRRHYSKVEEDFGVKSSLILCFPLKLKDGRVYGAVQIIDTTSGGDRLKLDRDYLELLEILVAIGGYALSAAISLEDQQKQNLQLRKMIVETRPAAEFIGKSPAFLAVMRSARTYAANDFPVLITGESGTGKELIAREIHRLSPRAVRPFLAQNCSAIPDTLLESELFGFKKGAFTGADNDKLGLFEAGDGGTVFLDEIGDMPLSLQGKILRVLQSGEIKPLGGTWTRTVNARIIAATNRDLPKDIRECRFREDLFYRLNVLPLTMPPLRDRRDDIPLLLNYFLEYFEQGSGQPRMFDTEVIKRLSQYYWPGNIREMENLVKYLITVAREDMISINDLPPPYDPASRDPLEVNPQRQAGDSAPAGSKPLELSSFTWEDLERSYVLTLLEKVRWNIAAAARRAGVKRSTFAARMRRMGIIKGERGT